MIAEFQLTLRLRNNRLIRRRLELGFESVREFCELSGLGLHYHTYIRFEALSAKPMNQKGEWLRTALRIAEFHGVSPEELWPEAILAVKKSTLVTEISGDDALVLGGYAQTLELPPTPEELLEKKELHTWLLDSLDPKERHVIESRTMDDASLKETGTTGPFKKDQKSRERIRQLERQGIQKLQKEVLRKPRNARGRMSAQSTPPLLVHGWCNWCGRTCPKNFCSYPCQRLYQEEISKTWGGR